MPTDAPSQMNGPENGQHPAMSDRGSQSSQMEKTGPGVSGQESVQVRSRAASESGSDNRGSRPSRARAAGSWLLRILQGALVGGGAILPGISGGVLCVTFGLYQPLMELLSHPIRSFRKHLPVFTPFLIGWITGFLGLARIVELMFGTSSALAVALFIGLIAGTLPALFQDAGQHGTSSRSWSGFAISLIVLYAFFGVIETNAAISLDIGSGWFFFTGVVWGLSLVVPGLSSSSVLIFLGLYQPMTAGIAGLDPSVILPLVAGIILTVALSARFVYYLLNHHYALVFHIILGIMVASTLMIVPTSFSRMQDVLFALASFAAGYTAARGMSRYGDRVKRQSDRTP